MSINTNEPHSPFGFRHGPKQNYRAQALVRLRNTEDSLRGDLDHPGHMLPMCFEHERAAALTGLEKVWASRPLKPPGK